MSAPGGEHWNARQIREQAARQRFAQVETVAWTARRDLIRAAIRCLASQHADETEASYGAEAEYANEQLALAARALSEATDKLPALSQPVGWIRS